MSMTLNASSHSNASKKVVVTSGTQRSQVSTESQMFSKDAPVVTGEQGMSTQETFEMAAPGQQDFSAEQSLAKLARASASPKTHGSSFSSLDADDKKEVRRIMKDLNKQARLFARNEEGQLVRIGPGTGKELLDANKPIEIVSRLGSIRTETGESKRHSVHKEDWFSVDDKYSSSSSSSEKIDKLEYSAWPITQWDSLLWHDEDDMQGVPGTPILPANGQPVVVSREWESKWSRYSEENVGFFTVDTTIDRASGHSNIREVPNS